MLRFDSKQQQKRHPRLYTERSNISIILTFVSCLQVSYFGIQGQVACGPDKNNNWIQQLIILLFLPSISWLLVLAMSNISQKISKWWEMTSLLFVCDCCKYKFKWRSGSKWKNGRIFWKLKLSFWKCWRVLDMDE